MCGRCENTLVKGTVWVVVVNVVEDMLDGRTDRTGFVDSFRVLFRHTACG